MSDDLRMDAYYYGFEETGCHEIDLILSAVACAGKAYHHTEDWSDECRPYPPHEGKCPVDWVQNAAQKAKDLIHELEAERDGLREVLRFYAKTTVEYHTGTIVFQPGDDNGQRAEAALRALADKEDT